MMQRDWRDFKSLYGNIEGARDGFEDACQILFSEVYPDKYVAKMAVKQGDGGIDICIGELGVEPIIVIQCKFFLETFSDAQKSQIRDSFERAINSDKYELKEWILCIPREIDIDETSWWAKWKKKKFEEHSKNTDFIKLKNGIDLIELMKNYNLYNQVFQMEDSLKIDEIHKAVVPQKNNKGKKVNPNIVLFNNYTQKKEEFYIERDEDIQFNQVLKISNIWVFGKSGKGKTALINRNLIQSEIDYLFCDLSPVTINTSMDILEDILCSIEYKFDIKRDNKQRNTIKSIVQLLEDKVHNKMVIVIDELSVSDEQLLKEIANTFIQLVTHYNNNTAEESELKFVVSTISEPEKIVLNLPKASDYFQYICCDNWEFSLEKLFDILNQGMELNIMEDSKALILMSCKQSPRILKNIFKKIVANGKICDESIQKNIDLTLKESV